MELKEIRQTLGNVKKTILITGGIGTGKTNKLINYVHNAVKEGKRICVICDSFMTNNLFFDDVQCRTEVYEIYSVVKQNGRLLDSDSDLVILSYQFSSSQLFSNESDFNEEEKKTLNQILFSLADDFEEVIVDETTYTLGSLIHAPKENLLPKFISNFKAKETGLVVTCQNPEQLEGRFGQIGVSIGNNGQLHPKPIAELFDAHLILNERRV